MTNPFIALLCIFGASTLAVAALLLLERDREERRRRDFDGIGEWERCRDALAPAWWENQ